jgi:hypothetical protein
MTQSNIQHNFQSALLTARAGYKLISVRFLPRPRLERERARDGLCVNLSAAERNRKKMDDAPWIFRELSAAIQQGAS